jgi:hypothetical protein
MQSGQRREALYEVRLMKVILDTLSGEIRNDIEEEED